MKVTFTASPPNMGKLHIQNLGGFLLPLGFGASEKAPINIKVLLISLLLAIISHGLMAQSVSVQWLKNSDGASWDLVSDMKMDTANNMFVVGNFTSTAKRDIKSSKGNKDIFIAKYNSDGEQTWFHQVKSKDYCHINSLDLTEDGKLLISGFFNEEMILDEYHLKAKKGNQAFFAVIDTAGKFQMVKHIEGYFKGLPIFVQQRADKGYWFVGSYTRDLIVDKETFEGNYSSEIFIGSFNAEGELENHLLLKGEGEDEVKGVISSKDGNLLLTGSFEKNLLIGNQTFYSKGYTDAFLVELNEDLEIIDSKQLGGIYKDYGKSIGFDHGGNYLWAGCFSAQLQTEAQFPMQSNGNYDVFIAKYNTERELQWMDQLGGKANDYLMSVACNQYTSIYLSGSFRGSIEKEDQEIESVDFSSDVFLAKFEADGRFRYMEALGDTNADYARQLIVDTENYIYLSGNFNQKFKALEDTSLRADGEDYFLTRLYDCDFSKAIQLPSDTALCAQIFEIQADSNYVEYIWNDISGNSTKKADSTAMYYLIAKDEFDCLSRDSIFIQLNDDPTVDLGEDMVVYQGDIIQLVADPNLESYQWSNHSTLSFMEINTQNLALGDHHYSVAVLDTNFCKGNGEINIKILGMDDIGIEGNKDLSLQIYPNPAKEQCFVKLENLNLEEQLNLEFFTLEGTRLWELKPDISSTNMEMELNVQDLVPGAYILVIKNGTVTLEDRVVVVK